MKCAIQLVKLVNISEMNKLIIVLLVMKKFILKVEKKKIQRIVL